jgi:hypothetical protein
VPSPRSVASVVDTSQRHAKAEAVFVLLVELAASPAGYTRLAAALPLARVPLLLLGDRPAPGVAALVLRLLGACVRASGSFARKFELVSGWSILRTVLPRAWDADVHAAAFDILLGRDGTQGKESESTQVTCPHICPAIFTSLRRGLETVAGQTSSLHGSASPRQSISIPDGTFSISAERDLY